MLSRWHNYYVEGLRWLLEEVEIDGIYLDGIGYDRDVMDQTRPGNLIDWHNGNTLQPQYGLSVRYMDLMPYMDSLWFGEMSNTVIHLIIGWSRYQASLSA